MELGIQERYSEFMRRMSKETSKYEDEHAAIIEDDGFITVHPELKVTAKERAFRNSMKENNIEYHVVSKKDGLLQVNLLV